MLGTLVLMMAALAYARWAFLGPSHPPEAFVADEWRERLNVIANSNDPGCVRGGMALDLIDRELLDKLQAIQVATLLGPPDQQSNSSWGYELGQCSGFGWHNSRLLVKLGSTGLVEQVEIVMVD